MPVAEIRVIPVGTKDPSISSYISACYQVIKDSGLKHNVTATATVVEGDLPELFEVVKKVHEVPFERGADRVVTSVSIDERRDRESDLEEMVTTVIEESSEMALGRRS